MTKKKNLFWNILLVVFNFLLITTAIITSIIYARNITNSANLDNLNEFETNVESAKKVTLNYIENENEYVENWANYISKKNMTLNEALEFLNSINSNINRYVHIVDMDDFFAYTYNSGEIKIIKTYVDYLNSRSEYGKVMESKMYNMFNNKNVHYVLGRYQLETGIYVISVGERITLTVDNGTKDYLLLRLIPISDIKETWVFPIGIKGRIEIGIIAKDGGYVIPSDLMSGISFTEFILSYSNFDYDFKNKIQNRFLNEESGVFKSKISTGEEYIWYFSSFNDTLDLHILGAIPLESILSEDISLLIVYIVAGTLLLLALVDGFYLSLMNKKLKETAISAKKANEAKTRFLSSMSHDMRTPLNTVLGLNYLAINNIHDEAYILDCLKKSNVAGKQLLTVINDVLDMSKIESGKLIITYSPTSLKDLFNELKDVIEPSAELKKLQFNFDISNVKHEFIITDKIRLEQIFINLLSNSVKYTNEGCYVNFIASTEDIDENTTILKIIVKDNGIGMSEEFQKNMYDSFAREDDKVNIIQGTGLGLSIVKYATDALGGTIDCESELGKGTTFTLNFTFEIGKTKAIENKLEKDYSLVKGMNVLIAEDNNLNANILAKMLENYGIKSDIASNGQICIDTLFSKPINTYDCILMDVHMPVKDGLIATKEIRDKNITGISDIIIIALTADVFQENVNECVSAGMNYHITKPVDIKKLIELMEKIKEN